MYDVKLVTLDGQLPGVTDSEGLVCCQFLVEMKDLEQFDQFMEFLDVPKDHMKRPNEDIEEYRSWGDEHLCVNFIALVPEQKLNHVQEHAGIFSDQR